MNKADFKAKELKSWSDVVPGFKNYDVSFRNNTQAVNVRMLDLCQIKVDDTV